MQNQITFSAVHKSITNLEEITMPGFVVLTGRNGSGKTHLLTAIKAGKIKSSLVSDIDVDVKYFDSSTIIPTDTGIFDPAQAQTQRSQWFVTIENRRKEMLPNLQSFAIERGIPSQYCSSIKSIVGLSIEKLREILGSPENAETTYESLQQHINNLGIDIGNHTISQIGDEFWRKTIPKLQAQSPSRFLVSSQADFYQDENFLWGEVDPFKQAFGRVFSTYRTLIHENDLLEKYPPGSESSRRHRSAGEFVEEFGVPPWDFVNEILAECKLDFRVDHPPLYETFSYEPKLQKISKDVEMRFEDLSSGEKVLMSFALCLYNTQETRQSKSFPKLLLLDEVDAPLHPSMAVSLISTIQNVLVAQKNVAVILTTHSPSTVALAPDDSIYAMNPDGPKVEKVSKSYALSLLTAGVPTLSISFDGRRQVFVESRNDARIYDLLYQKYKGQVNSELSPVFIEVGHTTSSGGEANSGCEQVNRLVQTLSENGNASVFGLVDWDGNKTPSDRIFVLSAGIRDGLESLLFDPVLLVSLIVREKFQVAQSLGVVKEGESYTSLHKWDAARWQEAIDVCQKFILQSNENEELLDIKYLNDMTLKVRKAYLHMDDHELEKKIFEKFGFLQPLGKRAGDLMMNMVEKVLGDEPNLLPCDFIDTLRSILSTNQVTETKLEMETSETVAEEINEVQ